MVSSFDAQLQGNQLILPGARPPLMTEPRRVVLVFDDAPLEVKSNVLTEIFNRAKGSKGKGEQETVLADLAKFRDEWDG